MKNKFCPKCGSININYDGVGLSEWRGCSDYGYRSVNFPEKEKLKLKPNKQKF